MFNDIEFLITLYFNTATVGGQRRGVGPKKAPELLTFERRNWLIHNHYIRKEFDICKTVIRSQLDETHGMCEYANYIQGLILRQEGKIQESLEMISNSSITSNR